MSAIWKNAAWFGGRITEVRGRLSETYFTLSATARFNREPSRSDVHRPQVNVGLDKRDARISWFQSVGYDPRLCT